MQTFINNAENINENEILLHCEDDKEEKRNKKYADDISISSSDISFSDNEQEENKYIYDKVTRLGLIWSFAQIIIYTLDVISDTYLSITYFIQREYLYGGLTLSVIYIAACIDAYFNRSEFKRKNRKSGIFVYIFLFLLNMRGIELYIKLFKRKHSMFKGVISVRETQESFFYRNFRVANLKTHEGLFEACPQLIIQLSIMLITLQGGIWNTLTLFQQIVSIIISLMSLAATFITGDKARRLYEHERDNFSTWGFIVQFLWIFPVTASRIMTLSCLASVHPKFLGIYFLIHELFFVYHRVKYHSFTRFGAIISAFRMFLTPYEPIEEYDDKVMQRLIYSHTMHFIGNVVALAIWAYTTNLAKIWFVGFVTILSTSITSFIFGAIFLVILLNHKPDFFIQEHQTESNIDKKMKIFVNSLQGIKKLFVTNN